MMHSILYFVLLRELYLYSKVDRLSDLYWSELYLYDARLEMKKKPLALTSSHQMLLLLLSGARYAFISCDSEKRADNILVFNL